MRADMERELRLGRECHRATVTSQRLLRNMRPSVCCYVTFHCEPLLANITCVRPFTSVYTLVNVESGFLCESLHALVTLEGTLSSMRADVNLQVGLAGERGRALQALVRPTLNCVRPFVDVEGGLLGEALEADIAFVRPLSCVRAVVNLEVLLAGERRRTLQALERPALD